jgi:hypothetical protein
MNEGNIVLQYVDDATDPSKWINGQDTEYVSEFKAELSHGEYGLYVCVADTSKDGNPPGLNLAVKKGEFTDGWLYIGNLTIN